MCGIMNVSTLSPPPDPEVEWVSLPLTQIGIVNMLTTSTQSFIIPNTVPATAKEVLVYSYVTMGTAANLFSQMKIYTEASTIQQFAMYLPIMTYDQNAYSTVSDNMWFPNPSNGRVYVQLSEPHAGYVYGYVNIIGYR